MDLRAITSLLWYFSQVFCSSSFSPWREGKKWKFGNQNKSKLRILLSLSGCLNVRIPSNKLFYQINIHRKSCSDFKPLTISMSATMSHIIASWTIHHHYWLNNMVLKCIPIIDSTSTWFFYFVFRKKELAEQTSILIYMQSSCWQQIVMCWDLINGKTIQKREGTHSRSLVGEGAGFRGNHFRGG